MVFFRAIFFGYHFRDGPQPQMEPLLRTTSASKAGVWICVSTQRGRYKRSNEPNTAAQQHDKPHLPSTAAVSRIPSRTPPGITTSRWNRMIMVSTTRALPLSSQYRLRHSPSSTTNRLVEDKGSRCLGDFMYICIEKTTLLLVA